MKLLLNKSMDNIQLLNKLRTIYGVQRCQVVTKKQVEQLDKIFDKYIDSGSTSMLFRYLNEIMYEKLKHVETPKYKSTLLDCCRSGFKNIDSKIGVYASDHEAYDTFKDLFDPIVLELHGFKKDDKQPEKDYGNTYIFRNLDPRLDFILSTRIRVSRNLVGYPFLPFMNPEQLKDSSDLVGKTLRKMQLDLAGFYHEMYDLHRSQQLKLIEDHMYKDHDRFMIAGNMCRHMPVGRSIFYTKDHKFSVWVNFEDHLKIVSMAQGGDFGEVFKRLIKGIEFIEDIHPFYTHRQYGNLTCCPTNLGTALRASVLIKLVKLPTDKKLFKQILDENNLEVRGTYGELTPVVSGVYDISNRKKLGCTEYDAVRAVYDGIDDIIKMEKCMKVRGRA